MNTDSKYALMQAPAKDENDFAPHIVIIDNSSAVGKQRVESLANEGYKPAGWIESPLKLSRLKRGFEANMRRRYEQACEKLSKIRLVLIGEDEA